MAANEEWLDVPGLPVMSANTPAHRPSCPRSQFWDAGEFEAPCTCDRDQRRQTAARDLTAEEEAEIWAPVHSAITGQDSPKGTTELRIESLTRAYEAALNDLNKVIREGEATAAIVRRLEDQLAVRDAERGELYALLFEWVDAFWDPLPDAEDLIQRTEDAIYDDPAATAAWRTKRELRQANPLPEPTVRELDGSNDVADLDD